MKAVMPSVPNHILDWRRRTGADRWDEMWNGVLRISPMPNRDHQYLEWEIETWLQIFWAKPLGYRVFHQINVAAAGEWPDNYRIPDLVLLKADRFHIDQNEYYDGGPNVAIEIRSAGDESYEKLPFYAEIGVLEVWVIDRDTRKPERYALVDREYQPQLANAEGWLVSHVTGIEFRTASPRRLEMRIVGKPETAAFIPG